MNRYQLRRDLQNMMIDKMEFDEKVVVGALLHILDTLDELEAEKKEVKNEDNR